MPGFPDTLTAGSTLGPEAGIVMEGCWEGLGVSLCTPLTQQRAKTPSPVCVCQRVHECECERAAHV